mmetsp:Transcript_30757/g.100337  ORF Transcript_30757/g.100337 Transcript_30757/m.100337 type:complete len:213 (+) Transcript_30757:3-641(+)
MMQCLHYLFFGMFMGVSSFLFGLPLTMAEFFDPVTLHFEHAQGVCVAVSWLLAAATGALSLLAVVERTKKCWDFGITVYFWHTVACSTLHSFPTLWEWWVTNIASATLMVLLGERLCLARESEDISVATFLQSIASHARSFGRSTTSSASVAGTESSRELMQRTASGDDGASSDLGDSRALDRKTQRMISMTRRRDDSFGQGGDDEAGKPLV